MLSKDSNLDSWIAIQIRSNTVQAADRCVIGKTAEDRRPVLQWIHMVHPSNMTCISARKQVPNKPDRPVHPNPPKSHTAEGLADR
jgi:hypothetical protein